MAKPSYPQPRQFKSLMDEKMSAEYHEYERQQKEYIHYLVAASIKRARNYPAESNDDLSQMESDLIGMVLHAYKMTRELAWFIENGCRPGAVKNSSRHLLSFMEKWLGNKEELDAQIYTMQTSYLEAIDKAAKEGDKYWDIKVKMQNEGRW